jgi:hypothetical protein
MRASFASAIVAMAAVGRSTNAVVHLLAIAGRLGVDLTLDDFDRIGSHVPLLVDLQPAGRFLMDDFFRAGGLLAVRHRSSDTGQVPAPLCGDIRRRRNDAPLGYQQTRRLSRDAGTWTRRTSYRAPS